MYHQYIRSISNISSPVLVECQLSVSCRSIWTRHAAAHADEAYITSDVTSGITSDITSNATGNIPSDITSDAACVVVFCFGIVKHGSAIFLVEMKDKDKRYHKQNELAVDMEEDGLTVTDINSLLSRTRTEL